MQVGYIDPNQWLPYMPGLVLYKWLELGAAKGRGTLGSYSCVVPSKLTGTLSVIIPSATIAALLVFFFFEHFPSGP